MINSPQTKSKNKLNSKGTRVAKGIILNKSTKTYYVYRSVGGQTRYLGSTKALNKAKKLYKSLSI